MSKQLLQQLRKQRELRIVITDRLSITARRPTDLQMQEIRRGGGYFGDLGQKFVIGWEGFTEDDIVGGGGSDAVPFDHDLWVDFHADHPEHWEKIEIAILDAYKAHVQKVEEDSKNSQPG